jgi:predicted phage terminase large subunit-like protein
VARPQPTAIASSHEIIQTWEGRNHVRRTGEVLSPKREPLSVLEALKLQIGCDAFAAQYQQEPVPPGGAMIKRHWIARYQDPPLYSEQLFTLQSWDTASKGGPENDWSACTTWIVTRDRKWHLLDVWRRRVDYPTLKANVMSLAKSWKAGRVLVEDTGAGISLVQELRASIAGIIAVRPESDKKSRMAAASAKFEAGQVLFPERALWLADLESELFAFPVGRHDDQCDSISQALQNNNTSFMDWMPPADMQDLLARIRSQPKRYPICEGTCYDSAPACPSGVCKSQSGKLGRSRLFPSKSSANILGDLRQLRIDECVVRKPEHLVLARPADLCCATIKSHVQRQSAYASHGGTCFARRYASQAQAAGGGGLKGQALRAQR